jgi:hypothetical protein
MNLQTRRETLLWALLVGTLWAAQAKAEEVMAGAGPAAAWKIITRNGDGSVVRDLRTGLEWTRGELDPQKRNYFIGDRFCDNLEWNGQQDWRLPEVDELTAARDNGLYALNHHKDGLGDLDGLFLSHTLAYEVYDTAVWSVMLSDPARVDSWDEVAPYAILCVRPS